MTTLFHPLGTFLSGNRADALALHRKKAESNKRLTKGIDRSSLLFLYLFERSPLEKYGARSASRILASSVLRRHELPHLAVDRHTCRTPHFLMRSRCTDCSQVSTVISRTRLAQDWSTSLCPT